MAGHDCLHCSQQHTPCCAECPCHDPAHDGQGCTCRPAPVADPSGDPEEAQ